MKPESRSMTLVDVMILSAGVAAGWAFPKHDVFQRDGMIGNWFGLMCVALNPTWIGVVAVSAVAVGRVARFRRRPRPAEWFAIVGVVFVAWVFNSVEVVVSDDPPRHFNARLVGIGVGLVGGLLVLRAVRRVVAPWAMTLGLAGMMALAFWGPLAWLSREGGSWLAPEAGYEGPGLGGFVRWTVAYWAAQIPMGLTLGVPAVGTAIDLLRRRRWTWVEWAGCLLTGGMLALSMATAGFATEPGSAPWLVEMSVMIGWLMVVVGLSLLSHAKLGPVGRFFYAAPQPELSTPSLTSPSSTA